MADLQRALLTQIRMAGLPPPVEEFKAIPKRRFRWDLAYPESLILIEIQGGIWHRGGHSTGTGITRDCEKLNLASLAGFHCFAFTSGHIADGSALKTVQKALQLFPPFH